MSILEAQDQRALAEWFQRMEMPYESISALELEGYQEVITPEADDTYSECEWCEAPIYYGNASVAILWHIEQVDWNDEIEKADVTVIDGDVLLTLCGRCGNRLDEAKLGRALKEPQRWLSVRPTE